MAGMLGIGSAAFGVIAIPILAAAAAGALTNDPPRAGVARLFAARYSILSALLLFAMPIAFATNLRPLLGNALVLESRPELAAVTFAAVTAAWVVVATGYVSLCLAHERMPGIPERPRERLGIADGIFSTPGGRLGMLAGASAPTVLLTAASSIRGVPVFSSMLHGASGGMSTWQALTGIAAGIALGLILLYFNSLLFTVIEPKAGRSFRMFSDVFTIFRPLTESKHAPRRIWQPLGRVDEYLKRMLRSGANQLLHGGELETGSSSLAEIGAGAWFQDQTAPRASGARGALQGARAWLKLKWNKLVTGLGAGYSDPARPGRLYPEHSFLAVQLLSLFAFYIIAGFALVPAGGGIRWPVPTLAFIALLLMILVYAITAAAFWFDRWRVPPSIVALLWIVAISWLSGLDHRFPTAARAACADAPCEALTPGDAADSWLAARRADGDACAPLIAVAVSGGGIRAAAWSTHVLTALEERYGDRFTERLHVISSVSGGSVGVVHYLSDFIERTSEGPIKDRSKRIGALQDVRDAASHESLRATAYGFVYPDFGRLVLPFALRARDGTLEEGETPVVPDRAVLLESVWRSQLPTNRRGDMLGDWREGIAAGARPVALINATSVETGRPFVMTSVDLDPNESESVASAATAGAFRDIPSFYKLYPKRDIHPMTRGLPQSQDLSLESPKPAMSGLGTWRTCTTSPTAATSTTSVEQRSRATSGWSAVGCVPRRGLTAAGDARSC